jgi:LytTr DNA-binding domain
MSQALSIAVSARRFAASTAWRWIGLGFLYWLTCMTALEPGNVAGASAAWMQLHWGSEALRLFGAGLLGASVTPVLLVLAKRFPIEGGRVRRALSANGVCIVALSLGSVVASCVLAAWFLRGQAGPSLGYIRDELFSQSALVMVCLSGFLAIVHAAHSFARIRQAHAAQQQSAPCEWLTHFPVKERGRFTLLDLRTVDWIETQGNYQALHTGDRVHLVRETSTRLLSRLDPSRFTRIHRRAVVALDRVRSIEPLSNGDALVRLTTGVDLRVTRRHRDQLRDGLEIRRLDFVE